MTALITPAEFAREIGVSRPYISKVMASGKLPFKTVGERKLIDAAEGKAALKSERERVTEAEAAIEDDGEEPTETPPAPNGRPGLAALKAETEAERAATLRLQRRQLEGRLIDREQVAREQETAARLVRQALDTIPGRAEEIEAAAREGGAKAVKAALRKIVRGIEERLSSDLVAQARAAELDGDGE